MKTKLWDSLGNRLLHTAPGGEFAVAVVDALVVEVVQHAERVAAPLAAPVHGAPALVAKVLLEKGETSVFIPLLSKLGPHVKVVIG
jgi:hypothetical protein